MAHMITQRDGLFVVRDAAWHGLGDVLPDYPTREVAQAIAHPWEPIVEPVYRREPVIAADGTIRHGYRQIKEFQANVRSDDGFTLGVTTDSYEPVTNTEMWDVAEAIEGVDKGSVKYETGGSLKGGSKVWLLLRLAEPLLINGDPHTATIPYFALQNSHDGSGAFRGQATMTRIVCDNTANAADIDANARGTEFAFSHTKNVAERIEEAKSALAGWRDSIQTYRLAMNHLITVKVTPAQRTLFIEEFIPMPPQRAVSDRVVHNVETARAQMLAILSSATCTDIDLTAYGLVQASIEYNQHVRAARSAETRFKRAYLDRSRITSDAIEIAQKVATV